MQNRIQLSQLDIEQELKRIRDKPLARYIDGAATGTKTRIDATRLSPIAEKFPCLCCKGSGWLYAASDLYTMDPKSGELAPLKRASGGAVRLSGAIDCPRCLGMQFDFEAWIEAQQKQAQGVAA